MKKTSAERRANARTKASAKGLPLRITRPNGAFQEIIDFEGSIPIYFTTTNANAAIATGASPGRTTHSLDGSGGGPFVIAATDSTFSGTSSITVTQATATITLGNLAQDWNDTPRILSIITDPTGLATTATYEGSPTPPTDVGIYTVEVNISDSNFQGSNSGQLVITGPIYNNWQGTEFTADQISAGDAAPTADADKDGLSNLAEYALGTDPNTATISPSTTLVGGFLTLTFDRPIGLSDVTYQAQLTHSLALNGWSPLTIEVMSQTSTTETVRARPTISQDTNSLFIRLRIDLK